MHGAPAEPSLAPRAAETIDPRVPIPGDVPAGPVDPALATHLDALVAAARAGAPQFDAREAEAVRLAAAAGDPSSEAWIVAQQALSRLIDQHGVTTRAAADVDELASTRLSGQRWIRAADQQAIVAAAAAIAAINEPQAEAIARLRERLDR